MFKKLSLVALCGISALVGCGSSSGWKKLNGTIGSEKAMFLKDMRDPSEENPVTGSIGLLETTVKNQYIIESVEFNLIGDYKKGGKTGGLTIETAGSNHSSTDVIATFPSMSSLSYTKCKFEIKTSSSYSLGSLDWKIVIDGSDLTFKFTYPNEAGEIKNFSYTIEV